jgi:hypothetical protein
MTIVYDILTYEYVENPQSIPQNWPAILKEVDSETLLEANWIRFNSITEYNEYLSTHSAEYESYKANKVLVQQKLDTWQLIKQYRDNRQTLGFKVGNYWFHSDDASRIKYLGLMMMGANIPANLMWKTMGGDFVPMTQTLATQIFMAVASFDSAAFTIAEQHKAAMQNSSDPINYDHSQGWPAVYGE